MAVLWLQVQRIHQLAAEGDVGGDGSRLLVHGHQNITNSCGGFQDHDAVASWRSNAVVATPCVPLQPRHEHGRPDGIAHTNGQEVAEEGIRNYMHACMRARMAWEWADHRRREAVACGACVSIRSDRAGAHEGEVNSALPAACNTGVNPKLRRVDGPTCELGTTQHAKRQCEHVGNRVFQPQCDKGGDGHPHAH